MSTLRLECNNTKAVNAARFCQKNLVKLMNPKAGEPIKMFCFPISQHCETTKEDMKMVFGDAMDSLQVVQSCAEGKFSELPNGKRRRITFRCDGLTSQIFSSLPLSLTRQISQINKAKPLMPLVKSLEVTTAIHDYFHETQFHLQDIIYRVCYPCFRQCFQLHLARKQLSGNPIKKDMQSHHLYLIFIYDYHLIRLFNCFV